MYEKYNTLQISYWYKYVLNHHLFYTDPSGYNTKLYIDAIVSYLQSKGLDSWSTSNGFHNSSIVAPHMEHNGGGGGGGGYFYTSYSGGWERVWGVVDGKERWSWNFDRKRRHSTGTNWVPSVKLNVI